MDLIFEIEDLLNRLKEGGINAEAHYTYREIDDAVVEVTIKIIGYWP